MKKNFKFLTINITEFGIAVTTNTSILEFNKYSSYCKYILMMTTTPGESGGDFNNANFKNKRLQEVVSRKINSC